ncbi:MAG: right-handed parallel beta-helix repeat-containing protein [Armatimonadetes bacterium]|nr:right-handed parallel beta-helix repeat-containing protein [Armatimonadota bacterium]
MSNIVTVGAGEFEGDTGEALQRAVDKVAAGGGGTVEVKAGTYQMQDALHLRSRVRIVGEPGAVLLKKPSVSSLLADYLGYGHYEFTVEEPDKFRPGIGVHVGDNRSGGFYDTVATITGRKGDLFFIDRMLNHDYHPSQNGRVTTLFSLIDGWNASDASVENLVLDGNPDETQTLNGCRGGGAFLLLCRRVRLQNIEVRHFKGDAVSFQQCADIIVRGCHLHDNTGGGLHPGSGSVRYLLEENHSHDNGGHGLFYCLRTTHSVCAGNRLEGNGAAGISIGERDTDHLIRGNTITGNRRQGIEFRKPFAHGGDRVRIENNNIGPNCCGEGEDEITIPAGLEDIHIVQNTFHPGGGKAIRIECGVRRVSVAENFVSGHPQEPSDIAGSPETATFTAPDCFPPLGPESLPLDGARHLAIEKLPVWEAGF